MNVNVALFPVFIHVLLSPLLFTTFKRLTPYWLSYYTFFIRSVSIFVTIREHAFTPLHKQLRLLFVPLDDKNHYK